MRTIAVMFEYAIYIALVSFLPAGGPLSTAFAQSLFDEAVQADATALASLNYELNGYVRAGIFAGPASDESGYETRDAYAEAALKLRLRKGALGDAYTELRLRNPRKEDDIDAFDLREAYVNLYTGPVDTRMGWQVVQWGKADGYNPTNVITPMDLLVFSPDEDDRRLSNLLIRSYVNLPVARIEIIWVPAYEPSVLPFDDSDLPDGVALGEPDYPDTAWRNSSLALKAHYEGAALESSISYFNGYMPIPGISAQVDQGTFRVFQAAYRGQMIGADFSTAMGSFGLRGEFAFKVPDETEETWQSIPNRQIELILGVDREMGNLSLIVQYMGKHVFDFQALPAVDPGSPSFLQNQIALWNRMISGQQEEWVHAVSFRPALSLCHETLAIELLGQVNFSTEEVFLKPKVSYDLMDDLTVTAGAMLYYGPDETLFGFLEDRVNALFMEAKASF
jgi:hypothetical protein